VFLFFPVIGCSSKEAACCVLYAAAAWLFGDKNPVVGVHNVVILRASCMSACESRHACVLPPLRLLRLIVVEGLSFVVMPSTAVHQKHSYASERAHVTNSTLCDGDGDGDDRKVPGAVPRLADMDYGKLQLSSVTTAVLMLLDNGGLSDTLHRLGKIIRTPGKNRGSEFSLSMFASNFMAVQGDYPGHWNFADSFARHPQRIPPHGRVSKD
jgi:hypothetical protein